jgi:hypothetical protein
MKTTPDSDQDRLLDATLADDQWQAFAESLRVRALATFHGAQRRRQWQVRGMQAAMVAVLLGGGLAILRRLDSPPAPIKRPPVPTRAPASSIRVVSEQELLAMFPPGSCVVAEINGQKELVLLDPARAAQGFKFAPEVGP